MGVAGLATGTGMAFVYEEPVSATFWMKDTLIPLSIAFVDAAGHIVTIADMQPCSADPCPTYAPSAPFVMAIETNIGFFRERAIEVGDTAELTEASAT